MKHQITWYILPSRFIHQISKAHCYGWMYQVDSKLEFQEIWEQDPHEEHWCHLCLLYGRGLPLDFHPIVIAKYSVSHVYASPMLDSAWNVRYLCMGTPDSPFLRKFNHASSKYKEVFPFDIVQAEEQLEELGQPCTDVDRQALEESLNVIRFLKEWVFSQHIVISKEG